LHAALCSYGVKAKPMLASAKQSKAANDGD
jgi:hypothetical protein